LYNFTSDIDEEDSLIVCYPVTKERVLEVFKDKPLDFKPGKGYSYNNSGFFLAGMVIEKVTGKAYEQVIRERIFQPLGMHSSGFDFINLPAQSRAMGYQFLNEELQKPYRHYDSTLAYAAGSIYSTTGDMYKWAKAIASKEILSEASWKQALKRQVSEYGYGFFLGQFQGKRFIRHSGGYPGFMSEFVYYPDEDLTIILLNNYGNYDDSIWPVAMALSNIVFEKPYELWIARKETKLPETVLSQYTGKFGSKKTPVKFFLQEGRLHCSFPNGGEFALLSENETNYFLKSHNTRFRFLKNTSGQVEKVTIYEHGQEFELPKVE
jgi:CubicO group peptidase (beta-lactamase class C family)